MVDLADLVLDIQLDGIVQRPLRALDILRKYSGSILENTPRSSQHHSGFIRAAGFQRL